MARTEDAWWTPGHMAASSGRYECLKLLIESNIDVNVGGGPQHSSTLLHEACHKGHADIVKLLLENGANPSLYDGHNLAHHIATRCGHSNVLEILLNFFEQNTKYARLTDAFTNVDPTSNALSYHNALHMASLYNRKECLKVLLDHKAKHLPNGMHQYPVMLAAFKMNIDCLKILLHEIKQTWRNTGDNVLQSEGHYSALHHLCIKTYKTNNKSIACACLLLNSGLIEINQFDEIWEVPTCLFLAARNGDIGMVQYLLNSGANPRLCGSLSNYLLNNPQVKRCADIINDTREEPMKLLLLSKLAIRNALIKNSQIENVKRLPLPNYLKNFVLHGHYHGIVECLIDS